MPITAKARIAISFLQAQHVPLGSHYDVYRDNRDGALAAKINFTPVDAWPDGHGKVGAGLGPAGYGPAGYGNGGVGAGAGPAGYGMAGFGGDVLSFTTEPLLDGDWLLGVVAVDPAGNPATDPETYAATQTATVAGTPKPPASIAADSYDAPTETLTLTLGLSPDDAAA